MTTALSRRLSILRQRQGLLCLGKEVRDKGGISIDYGVDSLENAPSEARPDVTSQAPQQDLETQLVYGRHRGSEGPRGGGVTQLLP